MGEGVLKSHDKSKKHRKLELMRTLMSYFNNFKFKPEEYPFFSITQVNINISLSATGSIELLNNILCVEFFLTYYRIL